MNNVLTRLGQISSIQKRTTNLQILLTIEFGEQRQIFLSIAFFLPLSLAKCPWLQFVFGYLKLCRDAQATTGSVILVEFLKFSMPILQSNTLFHSFHAIAIINFKSNSYQPIFLILYRFPCANMIDFSSFQLSFQCARLDNILA